MTDYKRTHEIEVTDPDGFTFTLRGVTDEGLDELKRTNPTARQLEAANRKVVAAIVERCPDCDRPFATEDDLNADCPDDCDRCISVCWRRYEDDVCAIKEERISAAARAAEEERLRAVGAEVAAAVDWEGIDAARRAARPTGPWSAYQRYLHGEEITAEEAAALIASCPRCSECPGEEHHWMGEGSAVFDVEDDDVVAEFKRAHPQLTADQVVELIAGFEECKHCPAVRVWDWDADDYLDEDMDRDTEEEE